ncbi:hypothetical protein MNEG_6352 [Monoraphidium neglectum]|uniref:Pyrroline-5-carboxylate reductase catalytic N-terminal domain-containing protein n=1 Tax=Monoraphidium neglectum TaxID=145388 RepID=A0A0D2MM46_9CHLO|nr:hypothetical protein MNEG_6352 [Monoraphidium neglectum]KIZ01607.1 hypothetical protein MNEG_6352 [Monoraphidium neglectum]|eukprot:XP_013900626.1 hypothetical protein MNEG_6352 [Monoraphidium neglectum]
MRIGVIGAGNVGKTLGGQLATKHTVKYGCRDPAKHPGIGAAPVPSVCDWAEVLLVCTPGFSTAAEAEALATSFGPGVRGKVFIDATNPLSAWPKLEGALPSSYVFKAFNTIGLEHMAALGPQGAAVFGGEAAAIERGPITMLYAGAEEKRAVAAAIISDVGFDPRYVGPIRYARNLEAIAELWIHCGIGAAGLNPTVDWGGDFAFQVVGGRKG